MNNPKTLNVESEQALFLKIVQTSLVPICHPASSVGLMKINLEKRYMLLNNWLSFGSHLEKGRLRLRGE